MQNFLFVFNRAFRLLKTNGLYFFAFPLNPAFSRNAFCGLDPLPSFIFFFNILHLRRTDPDHTGFIEL